MTKRKSHRITLTAAAILAMASAVATAAPKIQFTSETIDFGKVISGNPIKVNFEFKNAGEAELQITEVKAGCGCTSAAALEKTLAPGASSSIEAVFNSTGYSGRISKGITVTTNDPGRQSLTLSITGDVTPIARLSPEMVNFGTMKVNTSLDRLVVLFATDPKTFEITKLEIQGTHVSAPAFRKIEGKDGVRWQLPIRISAGPTAVRVYNTIVISTNAGENVKLNLRVFGNVLE